MKRKPKAVRAKKKPRKKKVSAKAALQGIVDRLRKTGLRDTPEKQRARRARANQYALEQFQGWQKLRNNPIVFFAIRSQGRCSHRSP